MQLSYRIGQINLTKMQQNETREGHDFLSFFLLLFAQPPYLSALDFCNSPVHTIFFCAIFFYNLYLFL